jgi:hypothetical protein
MAARVGVETRKARKEREVASEAASLPVRVGSAPRGRSLSGRILHKGRAPRAWERSESSFAESGGRSGSQVFLWGSQGIRAGGTMTRKGQKQKTKEEIFQEAQRLRAAEAAREAAVAADESIPEVFEDQTKFDKMVGSGQSHAGAQVETGASAAAGSTLGTGAFFGPEAEAPDPETRKRKPTAGESTQPKAPKKGRKGAKEKDDAPEVLTQEQVCHRLDCAMFFRSSIALLTRLVRYFAIQLRCLYLENMFTANNLLS